MGRASFRILLLLGLSPAFLFSAHWYGLLRSIDAASYLVLHEKNYEDYDCRLYGVATPDLAKPNTIECEIDPEQLRIMAFYTTLYATRILHAESLYGFDLVDQLCIVYNGGRVYNLQLIADGYGVPWRANTQETNQEVLTRAAKLLRKAKQEKRGLWNEWEREMSCLERTFAVPQ